MPRRACRKDANHDEIANAFRKLGWYWKDTYKAGPVIPGFFDGIAILWGHVLGVEVKSATGKLTDEEETFHAEYPGMKAIIRSVDDVIAVNGWWRERWS